MPVTIFIGVDHQQPDRAGRIGHEQRHPEPELGSMQESTVVHCPPLFPTNRLIHCFIFPAPCRETAASYTKSRKSCVPSCEQIPPFAQKLLTSTLSAPHGRPSSQAATRHASSLSCSPATRPVSAWSPA